MIYSYLLRPFLCGTYATILSANAFADTVEFNDQNPTLREHSLYLCLETQYGVPAFSEQKVYTAMYARAGARFVDHHVDQAVEDFLKRLSRKLGHLRANFNEAQRSQKQATAESAPRNQQRVRAHWQKKLKIVADDAKQLRRMLAYVLRGLDTKSSLEVPIDVDGGAKGYQKQMEFIEKQLARAERQTSDYFAAPTHTVHVRDLGNGNMMISLDRVGKMAKQLSRLQWEGNGPTSAARR